MTSTPTPSDSEKTLLQKILLALIANGSASTAWGSIVGDIDDQEDLITKLSNYVLTAALGAANGVATLGADSKLTGSQVPAALLGALNFMGTWDATANTTNPDEGALVDLTPAPKGQYWQVTAGGATSLGGHANWQVGDWVVSVGDTWDKVDNTDAVISVAGKIGLVTLELADIAGLVAALENPAPNSVSFDLNPTGAPAVGRMAWNSTDKTLDLPLNADVTLQIGQELFSLVVNKTGATIENGKVVKLVGAQGQRMKIELATSADSTAHTTLGVATQSIADNAEGFVTTHGLVRGLDTSDFLDGDDLWLSTGGDFTATKPPAPAHAVRVGAVVNAANGGAGSIRVHIETGADLGDLHDALISNPVDGDTLTYDSATETWKNKPGNRGWNEQTGTAYTLVAGDAGKTVGCTNAAAIALTIPTNAVVPFPIGTIINFEQGGAGKITFGGAGVTIQCPAAGKTTSAQYAGASLQKRDTDTWWLEGRLE